MQAYLVTLNTNNRIPREWTWGLRTPSVVYLPCSFVEACFRGNFSTSKYYQKILILFIQFIHLKHSIISLSSFVNKEFVCIKFYHIHVLCIILRGMCDRLLLNFFFFFCFAYLNYSTDNYSLRMHCDKKCLNNIHHFQLADGHLQPIWKIRILPHVTYVTATPD
jgi:hypothetical protein